MAVYYNEIDPFASAWLKELIKAGHIAAGEVDTRSIEDVRADDLRGFTQCHFFAGIGVWNYALRCAGWPDDRPAWTGSCPCQPFSAAGKRGGTADERHLWPAWFHLIEICRPATVFGEQVASKDGLAWLDLVHADLEGSGYAVGAVDLCAAGFGAPHIRQRLFFVGELEYPIGARFSRGNQRGLGTSRQEIQEQADGPSPANQPSNGSEDVGFVADSKCRSPKRHGQELGESTRGVQGEALQRERIWIDAGDGKPTRLLADASGGQREQFDGPQGDGVQRPADDSADRGELGDADGSDPARLGEHRGKGEAQGRLRCGPGDHGIMGDTCGQGLPEQRGQRGTSFGAAGSIQGKAVERTGSPNGTLADTDRHRRPAGGLSVRSGGPLPTETEQRGSGPTNGFWSDSIWLPCRDGKARPTKPGLFPLAHGAPARVGRLRGYGNCIVGPQAEEFIRAYMEGI